MWDWDFTPASSGRAKPVTKRQLLQMRQNYADADRIAAEALARECAEKEKVICEMDDLLWDVF